MTEQKYRYLFPYEKIKSGSKILIYGAGTLGQDYYNQMLITHYCEVIGFVDKNYAQYAETAVPVYAPEQLGGLSFDYVVVALRMAAAWNEVKRILAQQDVPEDKVVAVFEREYQVVGLIKGNGGITAALAYEKSSRPIAVLATGGFGDMVIQKRLMMEIIRLQPDCMIDIYNIKAYEFLKYLYMDVPQVNEVVADLGVRYSRNKDSYALALTIEACHFIRVDVFDEEAWERLDARFADKIRLLKDKTEEENAGITTPVHVTMYRRWYTGCNAYTGFNYDGVFDITDKKVNIPLDERVEEEFRELSLGTYLTMNCGNGDCADGSRVAKSWPEPYFDVLAENLRPFLGDIRIVQLGSAGSHRIRGCSQYILGADFRLAEYILKYSLLHIDIEGGLVHIATQLGTKCVVLFGPTVEEYYGYEENINIRVGGCRNCWGLYTDLNRCARGLKHPECMYRITPDLVLEKVKEYLCLKGIVRQ